MRLPSIDERPPYHYVKHILKLIRRLGDSDLALQRNKVVNLCLVADYTNDVHISPGGYFSFYRLAGQPSARHDFVEDMELSFGEACSGVGGGICQLSNLIHWIALRSPLRVVEQVNHSFNPLPSKGWILPFGSGVAIFYSFVGLVLCNPTADTFQLRFHIATYQLGGELPCSASCLMRCRIYEKTQRFVRDGEAILRPNEVWCDIWEKGQAGTLLASKCLHRNRMYVKYPLEETRLSRDWRAWRAFLRFRGHRLSTTL